MRGRWKVGASVLAGVALLAPASAHGAVTIGSNLGRTPSLGVGCIGGPCTFALQALDSAANAAPDGVTSPVNGIVTKWRIRTGGTTTSTSLRIVRPLGVGQFTGAGTSTAVTPPINTTIEYPAQLPIQAGDLIGINCCQPGTGTYFRISDGDTHQWFAPGLADGSPGEAPDDNEGELLLQADIEPTAAFVVDKVKSKKRSVTVVTATVPNRGKLTAGDPSSPNVGAAVLAAKKKKKKLFNNGAFRIGGPGQIKLSIRASKVARRLIRDKGRAIKAKLKIAFVPAGGAAAAQTVRVKLKP
jgi:hypothetical protein